MKDRPCEELSNSTVEKIFHKADELKKEEKEEQAKADAASNGKLPNLNLNSFRKLIPKLDCHVSSNSRTDKRKADSALYRPVQKRQVL